MRRHFYNPNTPPVFGGNGPQGRFSGYNPLSLHTRSLAGYTIDMHEPSFWKRHPFSAIEFALVGLSQERSSSAMHEGQQATVLQLPAQPKTPVEAESQTRVVYVG